ncbi:MAG: DegT/DnrJ/EryC1/StrS family aminotransferase [bacterium]
MHVPFIDLIKTHTPLNQEILAAWEEILNTTRFVGGPHVDAFEDEFAGACGVKYAVAVHSGTDGIRLALLALGVKPGDEIITVPNTFIATTEAITQAGAKPIFIDIDPHTYNMDVNKIESAITAHTVGIVPVHLYGQPCDMDPICQIAKDKNLWVLEDACQAHLAEYKDKKAGSLGDAAAFSFYPGKNLGSCGEGGAVTTDNPDLAQTVRMLRDHGQARKYYHDREGYNARLSALQCAALRIKLKHLPSWTKQRQRNADKYTEYLQNINGVTLPFVPSWAKPVWHLYVILVENRDRIQSQLSDMGVSTALHYPIPLHLQKAYSYFAFDKGAFPVTESCATRLLSLPMFPELTEDQIFHVAECLRKIIVS